MGNAYKINATNQETNIKYEADWMNGPTIIKIKYEIDTIRKDKNYEALGPDGILTDIIKGLFQKLLKIPLSLFNTIHEI